MRVLWYFSLKVVAIIDEALRNPMVPSVDQSAIHESRVICSTSVIHQSDCILRHLVTEHMTTTRGLSLFVSVLCCQSVMIGYSCQSLSFVAVAIDTIGAVDAIVAYSGSIMLTFDLA